MQLWLTSNTEITYKTGVFIAQSGEEAEFWTKLQPRNKKYCEDNTSY